MAVTVAVRVRLVAELQDGESLDFRDVIRGLSGLSGTRPHG